MKSLGRLRFCVTLVALLVSLPVYLGVQPLQALAVEAGTTLLLYDTTDADSISIKDHYLQAHPGVRAFGLSLPNSAEEVLAQEYLDEIRQPILDHLNSQGWGADIDTFVTAKGLPLRIDAGPDPNPGPQSNWSRFSSLESELARLDSIATVAEMGDQNFSDAILNVPGIKPANPYYLGLEFDLYTGEPLPYEGPEGFDRSNPENENIRLVSRLDGFSRQDVFGMIDRAAAPVSVVPYGLYVLVDDDPTAAATLEDAMPQLAQEILPEHEQWVGYDNTNAIWTSGPGPVLGYVSHGVHGGLAPGVPGDLSNTGYINTQLDFEFARGAVFHTYESFNAFTFNAGSTAPQATQGQVAQWISVGGTAALGHVQEPGASVNTITNEDIFYDMLLSGYTLVESAWAATRQLSYVNTVVGDPLMRWYQWLPGDANLDGTVNITDFGILKSHLFQSGTFSQGDFNGDGTVNITDFGILKSNLFQSVDTSGASVALVPEPCSALLLCLGSLLIWKGSTRRRPRSLLARRP